MGGFLCSEGCFGCMGSETWCCLEVEFCLKSPCTPLCCGCCALRCVKPAVCCKTQLQCCCCVEAAAFPCDEEVPTMFGMCGAVCYPKLACCQRLGDITAKEIQLANYAVQIHTLAPGTHSV